MNLFNTQNINKKIECNEKITKKITSLDIEKKFRLNEMIIFEFNEIKITMETLYEKIESELPKIIQQYEKNKLTKSNPYKLQLTGGVVININNIKESKIFDFSIGNLVVEDILIKPIKGEIKINGSLLDIDIISYEQINIIIDENKFIQPYLECKKCYKKSYLSYYFLLYHSKCNSLSLYDTIILLELKSKDELMKFFPQRAKTDFNTPLEFDINFNVYFNRKKIINDKAKFKYYEKLESRKNLYLSITSHRAFGKYSIFYSFPGIGKSIGAIYCLKYRIDHNKYKTLYIHCKYLYFLTREYNYKQIQKILLTEIPFLFYNDYPSYIKCFNMIKSFQFSYNNTYIDLIEIIFKFLATKNEKYIIVFDQYNIFSDFENKIYNLIQKIINDESICYKFAFFLFMSINNKDVKEIKIENILNINSNDAENNKCEITEINDILYDKKFGDLKVQEMFEKLGKTIKNYNELSRKNEKQLNEYYKLSNIYFNLLILNILM